MYPPFGPDLISIGPLHIRWYAVCILTGAVVAAWFGAWRAARAGHNPEHAWNFMSLGLVAAIIAARLWYVFFEWNDRFAPRWVSFTSNPGANWQDFIFIINPATGGIAIQGGLMGAMLSSYWYARRHALPFGIWANFAAPCIPIGQVFGRWGNFFNQEAYGRPTGLPWGLHLTSRGCPTTDPNCHRVGQFRDLVQYPDATRFHPTFLYEALWNVGVIAGLLWIERQFRRWVLPGDLMLLYFMLYSVGRFWVEGFRVDSLCTGGIGGECQGQLRTAQVTAIGTFLVCGTILIYRHWRNSGTARPMERVEQPATQA